MSSVYRLRQLCLINWERDEGLAALTGLLKAPVCYNDPEIAHFRLHNGLIELGGDFLELVSPMKKGEDSAGERFLNRQGVGGYMVLLQCADAMGTRRQAEKMGIRNVHEINGARGIEGVVATHFHPRDLGAILSIDSMGEEDWLSPRSGWVWAGPDWQSTPADGGAGAEAMGGFAGAELRAENPAASAARWGELLGLPVDTAGSTTPQINMKDAWLRFIPAGDKPEGLSAIHLWASNTARDAFYARAKAANLPRTDDKIELLGVEWVATLRA